jgi:hypothetical protein
MKDMKFWEIRALVDFMYRGEVNVTQEELQKLLKAAEALQVLKEWYNLMLITQSLSDLLKEHPSVAISHTCCFK